jgi:endonuclease/exonuclease/phosphatase family metal-dependent hydrolase
MLGMPADPAPLRVLSANIQAGARTDAFRDYLTRSLSQVLPHASKQQNLEALAEHLAEFDLVGLQEADPGSLRSGFLNQTHYLAERAGFPYWSEQPNRRLGRIATSANALLCREPPAEVRDYALPGRLRGRGVLWSRFGDGNDAIVVLVAHLSLGAKSRLAQLAFIAELVQDAGHAVLMGDLNCEADASELQNFYQRTGMAPPPRRLPSFPSWQPRRAIDHILTTDGLKVRRRWLLPNLASDHLALAAEVDRPVLT